MTNYLDGVREERVQAVSAFGSPGVTRGFSST